MQAAYTPAQAADFQRRSDALVAALRATGLDHYVVTTGENIFHFTGATFEPLERPFFLVLGADGSRRMLVPLLEAGHLHKAWGLADGCIASYREFPAPAGEGWADRALAKWSQRGQPATERASPNGNATLANRQRGIQGATGIASGKAQRVTANEQVSRRAEHAAPSAWRR